MYPSCGGAAKRSNSQGPISLHGWNAAFAIFVATAIRIPHGFKCFRCPPCLEKAEKVIQTVYRWVEASEGRYQDDSTAVTVIISTFCTQFLQSKLVTAHDLLHHYTD